MMRLSEIMKGISFSVVGGEANGEGARDEGGSASASGLDLSKIEIEGLCADSRLCEKGELFFCLTGGRTDSHGFAAHAVSRGAAALVVERELDLPVPQLLVQDSRAAMSLTAANFYGNPASKLQMIGVTGTNGKTTVLHMLSSIVKAGGGSVGVIGTLGICYAHKKIAPELTTPDPIFLQEVLADMVKEGVRWVVMEVSAHALFYKKTEGIAFRACIFTNLTQDHFDFFKDKESYARAKMQLFLPKVCQTAIVNADDGLGRAIAELRSEQKTGEGAATVTYGLDLPADAFAILTHENLYGSQCMLNVNDDLCRVSVNLTGRHNVYNALAAATCARELGFSAAAVREGLAGLMAVTGRLQRVAEFHGAEIFVDYAHTPDGLEKSLSALKKHCKNRLVCLFGCGGNRDKEKRPLMGERAAKLAHFSLLTSDNPRYEDPLDIIADIEKGYRRFSTDYVVVPDRKKAIDYALDFIKKGDVLLVAGKGGEEYQEIMGIKYAFKDDDIIKKCMEKKRENPFL